jgi:hypothetical protein
MKPVFGARVRVRRRPAAALLALGITLFWPATAFAQLDPLLFLKRVPPTVIIVVDTSLSMLEDGNGNFYDPVTYSSAADSAVMPAFPEINPLTTPSYQRILRGFAYAASGYTASRIAAVPESSAFLEPTRYMIVRRGIMAAVSENAGSTMRWGLIRLRQRTPAWRAAPNCEKPVVSADALQATLRDSTPCNAGGPGRYGVYAPSVTAASYAQATMPAGTVMVAPGNGTGPVVFNTTVTSVGDDTGLVPAGQGGLGYQDRPIDLALQDAKAAAVAAMAGDTAACRSCRNTVVVLITAGKDDGDAAYTSAHDPVSTAAGFSAVTGGGITKRVPIVVVGVSPAAADEPELQGIAAASGGAYRRATSSVEVAAAINFALQAGFSRVKDFEDGDDSEFSAVSPIVGTVNMTNGRSATGALLPNTEIKHPVTGQVLPQRSNVLITAGFALPGFDGRIRAFRTYRPEPDSTKPTGYKFVNDGTPLWPDLDGRPTLAGLARTPADPNARNIYTYLPNGSGGGSVVAFSAANAAALQPHLMVSDASTLISDVRAQALGAIIGSTPALMDPPSLDPPPDDDYGRTDTPGTFAGDHKARRGIIFVGGNNGMIHAIDARTGYEMWAFIPYNLLPKLRALADGQPVEQFDYFVDSSPKIAEVKACPPSNPSCAAADKEWRSLLIIGQGQGGTFYQTFDVTEAGMGIPPDQDDLSAVTSLLAQFDTPDESIEFKWAFPNYNSFDPTYTAAFDVSDGTPGGRVKVFGDLRASATNVEKAVGYTWSDPAVGPLKADRSLTAVIVGSGYFPAIEALIPSRGASAPQAGNVLFLIDVDTGVPIGNPSSCSGAVSGTGCISVGEVASNGRKNGLQADPTAAGENGSHVVTKAYIGDIDGKYWRFKFDDTGLIERSEMTNTGAPIYASSALLFIGSSDVYMFFATGSDLLAAHAPGGSGTFRLFGLKDNDPGSGSTTKFSVALASVTAGIQPNVANGERPSTAPSVAGDIVFYTTTTESGTAPCADFSANLYGLTYVGGAAYDANGNGKIDNNESRVASTVAGRATAPFIVDQHLYFGTVGADGPNIEVFGDPEDFNNGIGQVGVRILSWREIR